MWVVSTEGSLWSWYLRRVPITGEVCSLDSEGEAVQGVIVAVVYSWDGC